MNRRVNRVINPEVDELREKAPILTDFVEKKTSFLSTGFSTIKVTENGKAKYIRLPIKSLGIIEFKEELEKTIPRPPKRMKKLLKDSPDGKELGIDKDCFIEVFDVTDEEYQKQFTLVKSEFLYKLVVMGLNVTWKDETGKEITDIMKKIDILKTTGVTGAHVDQLLEDILRLASDRETLADFLSGVIWG